MNNVVLTFSTNEAEMLVSKFRKFGGNLLNSRQYRAKLFGVETRDGTPLWVIV